MNIDATSGRPSGGWKGRGRDAERRKPGRQTDRRIWRAQSRGESPDEDVRKVVSGPGSVGGLPA